MKVYIGYKRMQNRSIIGVTIYSNAGDIVYSNLKNVESVSKDINTGGKFSNILLALEWGIRQVRLQAQKGVISEDESIYLILDNKTVYTWFERGVATKGYAIEFSNLQREINFLVNDVEILLSTGGLKKVTYTRKGTIEDVGLVKVTDLFEEPTSI